MNKELITQITMNVRAILEQSQKQSRRWSKNLCGACAVGSDLLRIELEKVGIKSHLVVGLPKSVGDKWSNTGIHCWLEGDNFLIDVTHSQADKDKPVVIIFKDEAQDEYDNDYENYTGDFVIQMNKAENDDYSYFIISQWVKKQNPYYTTDKIIKKYLKVS